MFSSVIGGSSNQVGVRNPTLIGDIDDHREAARSLQRYWGRASRAASLYPRATPSLGTGPRLTVALNRAEEILVLPADRRPPSPFGIEPRGRGSRRCRSSNILGGIRSGGS